MLETEKLVLLLRSLNERALGLNKVDKKMAAEKLTRPVEGFYFGIKSHIRLKAEKIRPKKTEKVDQEKMYPI